MDLVILICAIIMLGTKIQGEIHHTNLKTEPSGIYFEAQQPLYRVSEKWKLVGYVNIQEIYNIAEESIDSSLKKFKEFCKQIPTECNEYLLTHRIKSQQREIDQEYLKLSNLLYQNPVRDERYFLNTSKEVAPTDLEFYNKVINQQLINETIPNYVFFSPDLCSMIIESEIREITEIISLRLHELDVNFKPTKTNYMHGIEIQNYALEWTNEIERTARKMFELVKASQNIVINARNNILSPQAMVFPLLRSTIESIMMIRTNDSFPFKNIDIERLTEMSQIRTSFYEGKFIYCLEIPLVEQKPHLLYRAYSHPTVQKLNNETRVYAHVQPNIEFIAISPNKKFVSVLTQSDLNKCINTNEIYISENPFIYESIQNNQNCEVKLFTNLHQHPYEHCTLIIKPIEKHWEFRKLEAAILYTTNQTVNGKIICNDRESNVTLQATGIIKINPFCRLEVGNLIFSSGKYVENKFDDVAPHIKLELTDIFPKIKNNQAVTDKLQENREIRIKELIEIMSIHDKLKEFEFLKQEENEEKVRDHKTQSYHLKIVLIGMFILQVIISIVAPWDRIYALYRWIKYYDERKKDRQNRSPNTVCTYENEEIYSTIEV